MSSVARHAAHAPAGTAAAGRWEDHLGRPVAGRTPAAGSVERLNRALDHARTAEIAAEVVALAATDRGGSSLAAALASWIGNREGGLLDLALVALADCARAIPGFDPARAALPWAQAAVLAAERLASRPRLDPPADATPHSDLAPGSDPVAATSTLDRLRDLVASRQAGAAEAEVHAALAAGASPATVQAWLLHLAAAHPGDAGVGAIAAVKLADLAAIAGESAIAPLWPRLARALAQRPEALPSSLGHLARSAAWRSRLDAVAEDPEKARFFSEPKFRVHLVDGAGDAALRATWKALEFGLPHALLAGSLTLAAAERVLRFDPRHEADPTVAEGGADAAHLLLLAATVRQLLGRVPVPIWADLLLFAVGLVHASAAMDAPARDRPGLPEPEPVHQTWDHGPEIARIVAHLQAGNSVRSIAVLRAYFLLVLPDQPLCRQLLEAAMADRFGSALDQAQAIAAMAAAVDGFHALQASPHRELVLCAALHALAAARTPRNTWQLAQSVLDGLPAVRHLVGPGPQP